MEETTSSKGGSTSGRGRSWPRKLAWAFVTVFLLYLLFGFFVLPRIVQSQLVSNVQAQLGLQPTIADVDFNPLRLRLTIEGFELIEPAASAPLLGFESMAVDLNLLGFLGADASFDQLRLVRPRASLVIEESGELAVARLLRTAPARAEVPAEPEEEEEPGEPLVIDVASVLIEEGFLSFEDRSVSPVFNAAVTPIDLEVEAFTTRGNASGLSHLDLNIEEGTRIRWEGTLGAHPIRSEGRLEMAGFDLRLPWEWASERLSFEVTGGKLALALRYSLTLDDKLGLRIEEGAIEVNDLRVVDREDAAGVITLPSLGAEEIALAVGPEGLEQLGIGSVVGRGGRLAARIEADGDLQLARLLAPRTLESDPQEPPSTSAQVSESGQPEASAGPQALEAEAPESAIESEISLGRLALERFEIEFEDRSRASPVALSLVPVDLEVTNFRTASDQPAELRLELGIGEEGRVAVSGKARAGPVAGQLAIEAKKIALAAFQPYVEEAARLDLLSGLLETRLDVALGPGGGDEPPAVTVKGDLRVDDLRTRDRMLERDFVGWRALRLDGIDLSPGRLHLAEVGLEGAAAAFVIDARGRSNAAAIFASGEEDDAGGTPGDDSGEAPLAISVERITLSDARVDFEDLSVDPPVGLVLGPLSGGVTGLSSVSGTRSQIDFEGHVNDRAPLHLTGEINPLAMESGGDLALTGRGIPLAVLGGYAGRYVGWDIASGGLDLDLDYHLEGRNLKARNHILFKGLDLGERVGERTTLSMSLPVALVVMRDASGNLDFDLPVAGNLDDPDFSVLGVLGRTFTNLITKAATSPLALLPVRGGGDASRVAFAPGSDLLSEQGLPSLEAVAKVLSDEPRIQLEIQGRADFELDGAALGVDPDPENEASVAALSALARGRADRVRDALAADDGFDAKRLVLGDIEVGKLATDGVITTNLWLSTR